MEILRAYLEHNVSPEMHDCLLNIASYLEGLNVLPFETELEEVFSDELISPELLVQAIEITTRRHVIRLHRDLGITLNDSGLSIKQIESLARVWSLLEYWDKQTVQDIIHEDRPLVDTIITLFEEIEPSLAFVDMHSAFEYVSETLLDTLNDLTDDIEEEQHEDEEEINERLTVNERVVKHKDFIKTTLLADYIREGIALGLSFNDYRYIPDAIPLDDYNIYLDLLIAINIISQDYTTDEVTFLARISSITADALFIHRANTLVKNHSYFDKGVT